MQEAAGEEPSGGGARDGGEQGAGGACRDSGHAGSTERGGGAACAQMRGMSIRVTSTALWWAAKNVLESSGGEEWEAGFGGWISTTD